MKKLAIFSIISVSWCFNSFAASINRDCNPRGLVNTVKESVSPEKFWTSALVEIDNRLNNEIYMFRFMQLANRNDKIRANLDASEDRAAGIPLFRYPELERDLAETDRKLYKMDVDTLNEVKQWAAKCRVYANKKLGR
jgi:hypothetical protein